MPLPSENTGGGSTDICAVSPSDMAGQIDNLLTRIENLENAVAQMLGGDVIANQLSDISSQIGWVTGITYMGEPGWTQTAYGTLIPPAGWSLSSLGLLDYAGNPYQNMLLDSDGVLQWGIDENAHVSGESLPSNNYIICQAEDTALVAGLPDLTIIRSNGGSLDLSTNLGRIDINNTGLYRVTVLQRILVTTGVGSFANLEVTYRRDDTDAVLKTWQDYQGYGSGIVGNQTIKMSFIFYANVRASYLKFSFQGNIANLTNIDYGNFSVEKIG